MSNCLIDIEVIANMSELVTGKRFVQICLPNHRVALFGSGSVAFYSAKPLMSDVGGSERVDASSSWLPVGFLPPLTPLPSIASKYRRNCSNLFDGARLESPSLSCLCPSESEKAVRHLSRPEPNLVHSVWIRIDRSTTYLLVSCNHLHLLASISSSPSIQSRLLKHNTSTLIPIQLEPVQSYTATRKSLLCKSCARLDSCRENGLELISLISSWP